MKGTWQLNHAGMLARNRNEVLGYYQSMRIGLNVGPQPLLPHIEGDTTVLIWRKLDGDPVSQTFPSGGMHSFFDGNSQIGSLQLECIATGPGSFLGEYLERKGEGINHLCFNVPDPEAETARLVEKGCGIMFSTTTGGQIVENYLDTRACGDVILSLRPPAGEWETAWKAHHRTHPLVRDWSFLGVGVAVREVEAAARYYESLGFAEVQPEVVFEAGACRLRSRTARVGPISYEFVQPLGQDGVYAAALEARDEGIATLVFEVQDLAAETRDLEGNGVPLLRSGELPGGGSVAYFDTRRLGNTALKLLETR